MSTCSPAILVPARPRPAAALEAVGASGERGDAEVLAVEFEEYVVARGPALVRLARGLLRDPQAAEDVVQDVLARALVKWRRVSAADDVDAYVKRMVVNACTSWWRRAVRREHARDHDSMPDRPDAEAGRSDAALADRDHLVALLRRLPDKQRAVLVLRHYEGYVDAEIAELLGVSAVTVRSNAHRGLASLRRMLEAEGLS